MDRGAMIAIHHCWLLTVTVMMIVLGLATATATATSAATVTATTTTFSSAAGAAASALECRADYTGLALLSCQETTPQSPTASCCDALLYAIDIWPGSVEEGQGVCCLCTYMVAAQPLFDLPTAYVSCRGQHAPSVLAWLAANPTPPANCDDVCRAPVTPPPPPPSPSAGAGAGSGTGAGGGRKKQRRKQQHHVDFGVGVIVGIVLGSLAGLGLLVCCLYCTFFRVVAKLRRSPDPSTRGSSSSASSDRQQQQSDGLEMGRVSSSRRSTSVLLPAA